MAEDDAETVTRSVELCRQMGCALTVARSVAEADKAVNEGDYQVLVWDHNLPDGITLSLIEKAKAKFPRALMIAASPNPRYREMQVAAGCTVDSNPVELFDILRKVIFNYREP